MKRKRFTIKQLQKASKELNEVMGIEPAIDTKSRDREYLTNILRHSSDLILEDDEFTEDTWTVIDNLPEEDDEDDLELD